MKSSVSWRSPTPKPTGRRSRSGDTYPRLDDRVGRVVEAAPECLDLAVQGGKGGAGIRGGAVVVAARASKHQCGLRCEPASFHDGCAAPRRDSMKGLPGKPVRHVSLWLTGILGGLFAVVTVVVGGAVIKARRLQYPKAGALLIGKTGFATSDLAPKGTVQVASELWTATADDATPIRAGDLVSVVGLEGLMLKVRKTHP